MAAKLPSEEDLGKLPSLESGRPVSTFDTTAIGKGIEKFGQGAQQLGIGIADVGLAKDQYELATAKSDWATQRPALDSSFENDKDFATLPDRYGQRLASLRDTITSNIQNPKVRERFIADTNPEVTQSLIRASASAKKIEIDHTLADSNDRLENIRQTALKSQDPIEQENALKAGSELIWSLHARGFISEQSAQATAKQFVEKYAESKINILPPAEQIQVLRGLPQNKDEVLDRMGNVENATGNPAARAKTSSAQGNFQFIEKTWLDQIQKYKPELLSGRSKQDVLDLRADPVLSREMAGHLYDDNAQALGAAGIQATPANIYLAHFLGANDAVKVLQAPPGTPVAGLVDRQSIAANQNVLAGRTTDSVISWAGRKMGGVPGGNTGLVKFIPEDRRVPMLQSAESTVLRQQQQSSSEIAANQYRVQSGIKDDVASVLFNGKGVDSVTPDVVKSVLGDKAYADWQDQRDVAHRIWTASHDLTSLNDSQLEERASAVAPKAGESGFANQQQVFAAVRDRIEAVRKTRREDPAGSVGDDPTVGQAVDNIKPDDPHAWKTVAQARLAAQTRAGIPEDAQSPITKQEALQIAAPLQRAFPGQERAAIKEIAQQLQGMFGEENAAKAFQFVLKAQKIDQEAGKAAARMFKKLSLGQTITPNDARDVDTATEIGAANKAVSGMVVPKEWPITGGEIPNYAGQQDNAPPSVAPPPSRAIQALRANPELAPQFEQKYGEGSAKKVLQTYTKR